MAAGLLWDAQKSYQVQVRDGGQTQNYLANMGNARMSERSVEAGLLTIVCEMAYTIAPPATPIYTLSLVSKGTPDEPLDQQQVTVDELRTGAAPKLARVECFEC